MDHLMKLRGFQDYFRAQKAYLVQERIDSNAREVGSSLGLWCIDNGDLGRLLHSMEVDERQLKTEEQFYSRTLDVQKRQKQELQKAFQYLKCDYWTLPPNRNLINILALLERVVPDLKAGELHHRHFAYSMTLHLALATLGICGKIMRGGTEDICQSLHNELLGGPRERRDREALMDTLSRVTNARGLKVVPPFFDSFAELVARFLNSTRASCATPQWLEAQIRCLLLGDEPGSLLGVSERTAKLGRDLLDFACNTTHLDPALFVGADRFES
jgi:hypothetical protein